MDFNCLSITVLIFYEHQKHVDENIVFLCLLNSQNAGRKFCRKLNISWACKIYFQQNFSVFLPCLTVDSIYYRYLFMRYCVNNSSSFISSHSDSLSKWKIFSVFFTFQSFQSSFFFESCSIDFYLIFFFCLLEKADEISFTFDFFFLTLTTFIYDKHLLNFLLNELS